MTIKEVYELDNGDEVMVHGSVVTIHSISILGDVAVIVTNTAEQIECFLSEIN